MTETDVGWPSRVNEPVVLGSDDRTPVGNTTIVPYSAVVRVTVTFPDGVSVFGTGTMIGKNDVLTAGHVIYSAANGGWATRVTVTPGQNGTSAPFGSASATTLNAHDSYVATGSAHYDFAVVNLGRDLGAQTGWFDIYRGATSDLLGRHVMDIGYPGDLANGRRQYESDGDIIAVGGNRVAYDQGIDTFGGNSGGPIWDYVGGTATVLAVHTHGGSVFNSGTALTPEFQALIDQWAADGTTAAAGDSVAGTSARDTLSGGSGNDTIFGGGDDDSVIAFAGADQIYGNAGADTLSAGEGDDLVFGGRGGDSILGDTGADRLYGNLGNDTASGGDGMDILRGGQGNDELLGGDGDDLLSGNAGDDTLWGDNRTSSALSGIDTIDGGDGTDTAVYLGNYAAYTIVRLPDGTLVLGAGERVANVEYLRFADQIVAAATL